MPVTAPTPTRRHGDDGLTLVEMVVALGVLMVVLLSCLGVFITVQHSQQVEEGTDRAIQLANGRLERIRQLDWNQIGFYDNTYNDAVKAGGCITPADYATHVTGTETTVNLGTHDPFPPADQIKPCAITQISESRFRYTVLTTITWGANAALGLPANTATGPYSFKRVKVTVLWAARNGGPQHRASTESWFAPQGPDAVPPGIPVGTD